MTVERRSLAAQVTDMLREMILSGDYAQGEQLRQEQVAKRLGVSRIPVREAFHQLETEGLITSLPYKGATVSSLSEQEIREFFDIRATLEAELMARAVASMRQEFIDRALAVLERLNDAPVEQWGALNWEFHATLYEAADREITLDFVKKIHDNLDRYVRIQLALAKYNREKANDEHRHLVDLCRERKTDEAVAFIRQHVTKTRDDLLKHLEEQEHVKQPASISQNA